MVPCSWSSQAVIWSHVSVFLTDKKNTPRQLSWYLHPPTSRMFQPTNLPQPFPFVVLKKKKKKWHSVFRSSWSVWTKCVVAWSCAQEWRARDRCGREGNKRLLMSRARSPSTAPTCAARQLQCRTAGGGKSLIIACLPQCQVHLPLPDHKPALARLAALQKTNGNWLIGTYRVQ